MEDRETTIEGNFLTLLRKGHAYSPRSQTVIEYNEWIGEGGRVLDQTLDMVRIGLDELRDRQEAMARQGLPWCGDLLADYDHVTIGLAGGYGDPDDDTPYLLLEDVLWLLGDKTPTTEDTSLLADVLSDDELDFDLFGRESPALSGRDEER